MFVVCVGSFVVTDDINICLILLHSCQVSRIGREIHGFSNSLTVSRSVDEISRILANLTNFSLSTINLDNLCNFKCQEASISANLGGIIFKIFRGSMVWPPRRPKNFLFAASRLKKFFRSKSHSCQFQKVDNYAFDLEFVHCVMNFESLFIHLPSSWLNNQINCWFRPI